MFVFSFQVQVNMGFTKNQQGQLSIPHSIVAGAIAGCIGASCASPFYMVRMGGFVCVRKP